jgi:PAS domain S-box-containing protein
MSSGCGDETKVPQDQHLRVLLIEDNPNDVEFCLRLLRKAIPGMHCDFVCTPHEYAELLLLNTYDIILADYALENWTGLDALNFLQAKGKDIPFILVTGALGEQKAVECMKSGMANCIPKDRLDRLPVAISRALEDKARRDMLQQARQSLEDSEAKFRALAEATPAATFIEQGTRCCYLNSAAERITGYRREDLLTCNFWSLVLPDSRKLLKEQAVKRIDDEENGYRYVIKILAKMNEVARLDVTVGTFQMQGKLAALITAFDVTHRRYADEDTRHLFDSDLSEGWLA